MTAALRQRRSRAAVVVALLVALVLAPVGAASAIDRSKGHPGFCRDGTGVTVVVDFQQLGGDTIVRCNPTGTRGTGLDALKGAGFQVAGVQRWGEAFICRVENRPSAVEEVPISSDPDYREPCIDTPPAQAYWSYWHAGNNCAWSYSQWGVKNRDFVPGGFEGWSFSLDASADDNPRPRIAAVRPGTEGGACTGRDEPAPTSDDPLEQQPGGGAAAAAGGGSGADPTADASADPTAVTDRDGPPSGDVASGSATDPTLPAPVPREVSTAPADPADDVAFTGGEDAPDVRAVVKEQAGASDLAPWVAGGTMVLLLGLAALTARRRRRAREA